jgi:hypothetical protein
MNIKTGDKVRLKEKPTGYTARDYALTEGQVYVCQGFMGSNIITTTDVPGETASYHWERVEPA